MRFQLTLHTEKRDTKIPVNYQYPLSAAIYRILDRADSEYTEFLHTHGYGKGFKLFTFSAIRCPFEIKGDRFIIRGNEISFDIAFYLPDAVENFVKGLFQTQKIDIADKISKGSFTVASVETLPNELTQYKKNETIRARLQPLSPIVAGIPNEKGIYSFLSPEESEFSESVIYNWHEKIKTCFGEEIAETAVLSAEVIFHRNPPRSRLITIKANTPQQTKIRGWMNFELSLMAERRFIDLLMDSGAGVYNSMGCGMVGVVHKSESAALEVQKDE